MQLEVIIIFTYFYYFYFYYYILFLLLYLLILMKGNFTLKLIVEFTPKLLKYVEGGGSKTIFVTS